MREEAGLLAGAWLLPAVDACMAQGLLHAFHRAMCTHTHASQLPPLLVPSPAGFEVVAERVWDAPGAYPAFDPPEVRLLRHGPWATRSLGHVSIGCATVSYTLCASYPSSWCLCPPPLPAGPAQWLVAFSPDS